MTVEEALEGVGHPAVEVVEAFSVTVGFTDTVVLSTCSCICYQKSVLLWILVYFSSYFLSISQVCILLSVFDVSFLQEPKTGDDQMNGAVLMTILTE